MNERLTQIEATSIILGAGVGGGVMAVPYLAAQAGILAFLPVVVIAYGLNVILSLLLVDILVRDGRDLQIVELMRVYAFRGRTGTALSWVVFVVLGLSFVASLAAYVSGAGEVLAGLVGAEPLLMQLVVYALSAAIVFFGLKSVGRSEVAGFVLIVVFVLVIVGGSVREGMHGLPARGLRIGSLIPASAGGWKRVLALYGIVMYSMNAVFAVPQAVKGLGRDVRRSVWAVLAGTAINAATIVLVTLVAIAVSDPATHPVTEVAVVGIGAAGGPVVAVSGSLFVVIAMLTTYWSVSLALASIVDERLAMGHRLSWLVATVPALILIVFRLFGFVEYLQIAGGIVALVIVYVTVPMFLRARREHPVTLATARWLSSPAVLTLFLIGMVGMSVGSLLGLAAP